MRLKNFNTGTKLSLSFGFIIILTLAIVFVSILSLNEIEQKNNDYKIVINAQKDFLKANSYMESYLNEKDSVQYENCSIYLDSAFRLFVLLKPRLKFENLRLLDNLLDDIKCYEDLMQQNNEAISKQNEIAGDRRKMRIIFTEESKKSHISRDHNINYYFNQARLNAVYLLSSNDQAYYNETKENIEFALSEAKKINNNSIIKALDDYMESVKENYDLAVKIKDAKNAQILLGKKILANSDKMTVNFNLYQEKVRKSTKIFMIIFSIISIIISIIFSRLAVRYFTANQKLIEVKNKMLEEQAESLAAVNTLLEERQQQIEEQSEELLAQRDQLSQLNATKDKLFSILAHDLRNPFNAILGFSELLLKNLRKYTVEKIESQLNTINDSAKYTFELLDNLLQWSRSQRGLIVFEPDWLKISDHVNIELKNLRQQALCKNIKIDLIQEGEEKIVEADPNLINTVMRNLICNAIKFSHQGSNIAVKIQFNPNEFVFSVRDQGVGMTEERKNQLFNIIGNVSCIGTNGEKGTGLGLLLCADFIEKHKGSIGVESELNVGSTFYFHIPYKQEKEDKTPSLNHHG